MGIIISVINIKVKIAKSFVLLGNTNQKPDSIDKNRSLSGSIGQPQIPVNRQDNPPTGAY